MTSRPTKPPDDNDLLRRGQLPDDPGAGTVEMHAPRPRASLPGNDETERALLGALLRSSALLQDVCAFVRPEDFSVARHGALFGLLVEMANRDEAISPFGVGRRVERLRDAGRYGGAGYVRELAGFALEVTNEHVVGLGREVFQDALRRTAVLKLRRIEELILADATLDPVATVAAMADELGGGDRAAGGSAWHRLQDDLDVSLVEIQRRATSPGTLPGLSTGWPDLDRRIGGLQPGKVYVLAARPKVGKSVVAQAAAMHAALNGHGVGFVSLEMSGLEVAERAYANQSHVDAGAILRGEIDADHDWPKILEARSRMENWPFYVNDRPGQSIGQLRAEVRQLAGMCERNGHPLRLLVVDYLQLMQGSGRGLNRENVIAEISRGIKLLAKEMAIPIILLSQLSRSLESRPDKRPLPSDLRESGAIEQDADAVIFLYRDEVYNKDSPRKGIVEVIVSVIRGGQAGTVELAWIGSQHRVANLARGFEPPPIDPPRNTRTKGRRGGDPEDT